MADQARDKNPGDIFVALRSVAFYYLACSPCLKFSHRREAKQQAKREKEERARIETEQPKLYKHPSPWCTNPYWMEEIGMGPTLPKKGAAKRNNSQKKLDGAGVNEGTSIASTSAINSTDPGSSPTVVPEDADRQTTRTMSVAGSDLEWNHKRYQREDEELWGQELWPHGITRAGHKLQEVIAKAGESAGRLLDTAKFGREREVTEEARYNFYFTPRNPPVNDLHPPVVSSRPFRKNEYKWMLQPPPPAKVMEGKVPVSRSGSQTSMASRRTAASHEELGLGRLVGEKLVKDKIRKGELPSEAELTVITSRPATRRTRTNSTMASLQSQTTVRSRSNTVGSEESSDTILERRRKKQAAQMKAADAAGSESDDEGEDKRRASEAHAVQRPKLETIQSSEQSNKTEPEDSMDQLVATTKVPTESPNASSSSKPSEEVASKSPSPVTPSETETKERSTGGSLERGPALS